MQIPILSGIYATATSEYRTSYPRNMVPVPKQTGIAAGFLRPGDGLLAFCSLPGIDRGGITWKGIQYRVAGEALVRVNADGTVDELGAVLSDGLPVRLDYSFDRLAVASAGMLYYFNGSSLSRVTDPDLGLVHDVVFVDGYFMATDGEFLVTTELNDPTSVSTTKYGSSEIDPDPINCLLKLRNEVHALNRFTIEAFENVGGTGFAFSRIDGATVQKGSIGRFTACLYAGTIAFMGGGRDDSPGVYLMSPGDAVKISTHEIDQILSEYTEDELSSCVVESRANQSHQHLMVHLPDRCLVYDAAATQAVGDAVWFSLDSGLLKPATYRARHFVWAYDRWFAGDPSSAVLAETTRDTSHHFGNIVGWEFGTSIIYNEGRGAVVHEIELVGLPGRVEFGKEPVVWTNYSVEGEDESQEKAVSIGKSGERMRRIVWRRQGRMSHWRVQKFRGTSDAHISVARVEAKLESLAV